MRIHAPVCLFFRICLLIVGFQCYPSDMYEGDACSNYGSPGICRRISDCSEAHEVLLSRGHHHFVRCGFYGSEEIVCCPSDGNIVEATTLDSSEIWTDESTKKPVTKKPTPDTDVRAPDAMRKSEQACKKIKPYAPLALSYQIVDGEAAEKDEFPHMGALGYSTEDPAKIRFACGGSLISNRWVLTAAHCLATRDKIVLVRFGTINVPEIVDTLIDTDYNISTTVIHPEYKHFEKLNDIALLKLKRKVDFTKTLHAACLYAKNDEPLGLIVTGWGVTEFTGSWTPLLQKARLSPVPLNQCNDTVFNVVKKVLNLGHICAKDVKSDSCRGDSGGPLQIENTKDSSIYSIVGIVSYGIGCATDNPSVYTRIYTFLDWIESQVWP